MKAGSAVIIMGLALAGNAWASEHPEHPKAAAPAASPSKAGAGALDGKVFAGELVKAGEKSGDKDEITFKDGTFVSSACVTHGFNAAPYTAAEKDGAVTFTSSPSNAGSETMSWTGTVRNGTLEATAVHQTGSGKTEYRFKGKLSQAGTSMDSKEHPKSEHPK